MKSILVDMWEDGLPGRMVLAVMALLLALIPLSIWAALEEQKEWEAFSSEHYCKVVGRMTGGSQTGVGYGVTNNGKFGTIVTTTTTPGKTGYLCDDGVTYWR